MRSKGHAYNTIITLLALSLFTMAGCTQAPRKIEVQSSIAQADLLSGKALFDPKHTNLRMPDANVMKLSTEMRDYLTLHIPETASRKNKLYRLLSLMFSGGNLGISYDPSQTLTAENTFRSGSGNCLAVSYLFASMADELGLATEFQNVHIPPVWGIENDLIYKYRHVNVMVTLPNKRKYVVDVDLKNNLPIYKTDTITRKNAVAQYYSNMGAHYLAVDDTLNAFLYFKKAIHVDPTQAEFWSNLGVLYSKEKKYDHAESAYITALNVQHNNLTTINNMASLYAKTGQDELKEKYKSLAARHNNKNPYLRFIKASASFKAGDYTKSLSHVRWAIKNEKNEPKFYYLLARIYEQTGHADKAQTATLKGQKVAEKIKTIRATKDMRVRHFTRN